MNNAVHGLFLGLREAMTIWLALVALAVVACAFLSAPARKERSRRTKAVKRHQGPTPQVSSAGKRRGRPNWTVVDEKTASTVDELRRYAGEVAVAADRAADAATRWRAEWLAVARAKDAAWRAYETAEHEARRAVRAAAFPTPQTPLTPGECRARERYLRRAVTEAYRRGELSLDQLNDALSHRDGWDPRLHPFEQELKLRRIALSRRASAYRTISAMERTAWQAVQTADAAKASLRMEAYAAAVRARLGDRTGKAPVVRPHTPPATRASLVDRPYRTVQTAQ